jgi:hypothetical protein
MAAYKLVPDAIIDLMLGQISAATRLYICSDGVVDFEDASATNMLAEHTIAAGDFSIAAGDGTGRKLVLAAQNGFAVTNAGTAIMYVLAIFATSTIVLVGTLTSQALSAGNLVNFPATDVLEIGDVT